MKDQQAKNHEKTIKGWLIVYNLSHIKEDNIGL